MRSLTYVVFALATLSYACSGSAASAPPDPPPADPVVQPDPAPEPETPPPPAEKVVEKPAEPASTKALQRYRGLPIVATQVERQSLSCRVTNAEATLDDNRRACVAELVSQLKDSSHVIVVIDQITAGCKTCVGLAAEASEVANGPPPVPVLFLGQEAGTVECLQNDPDVEGEVAQKACYDRLRKEAGSLRAAIVIPEGIEQGKPCKSCISVVGTGYTAKVMAQ